MTAMTMTVPAVRRRPRLITRPLILVFAADFGGLTSFYLLVAAVPQYAAAGAGGVGAGLATGVLMLSTVAAEFVTPRLVAGFGHRAVLAAGLVLLGAPTLALMASASILTIMAVSVVRGVGLAIIFVVCSEMSAALVPPERRGEGLGILGVVAGLPAVIGTPLGLWLAEQMGYPFAFASGALAALAGLAAVPGLPDQRLGTAGTQTAGQAFGVVAALRTPALLRPATVFAATAMAAGIVVTFLPAAVPGESKDFAAVALLASAAAATVTRWWAGRHGDRHGPATLLTPGTVVATAGVLTLVLVASPAAVIVGMMLFGAGFGVAQNSSLATMYDRTSPSGYGTVAALWSIAYDTGWGLGAVGFGVVAAHTSYAIGFACTAAVMLTVLVAAFSVRPGR
jgi:predicted MFS family arabinose efflux permease